VGFAGIPTASEQDGARGQAGHWPQSSEQVSQVSLPVQAPSPQLVAPASGAPGAGRVVTAESPASLAESGVPSALDPEAPHPAARDTTSETIDRHDAMRYLLKEAI
jgi:hypothetical protein